MPTELLMIGPMQTITQNVAYAMPAKATTIQSLAAIESSIDGSTWAALTGANTTGVKTAARFVRCTTGATQVVCKAD